MTPGRIALVPVTADRLLELVLITSAIWLALLAAVVSGFVVLLERQNRTLQLLLERTEPSLERSTGQP